MKVILLRHGKAQADAPRGDHARNLTQGGRDAVRRVGEALLNGGHRPDRVVVSPAARTLETLRALPADLLSDADIREEAALYNAGLEEIVALLGGSGAVVLVIGHNPGLSQLSHWLAPEDARILKPADVDILEIARVAHSGAVRIGSIVAGTA